MREKVYMGFNVSRFNSRYWWIALCIVLFAGLFMKEYVTFAQETELPNPAIEVKIVAELDTDEIEVGDYITYTYFVTNSGNITIPRSTLTIRNTNAQIATDIAETWLKPLDAYIGVFQINMPLNPSESVSIIATHEITENDLRIGEVTNHFVAVGSTTVQDEPRLLESIDTATVAVNENRNCGGFLRVCGRLWIELDGEEGFSGIDIPLSGQDVEINSIETVETNENGMYYSSELDTETYLIAVTPDGIPPFTNILSGTHSLISVTLATINSNKVADFAYTIDLEQDSDEDGICNLREIFGYYVDKENQACQPWEGIERESDIPDVDLPTMGAHPLHKDIFVEIDYMVDYMATGELDHTHQPQPNAIKTVVDAFNNAPVENPDHVDGIRLHVDYGPESLLWSDGEYGGINGARRWGILSRGNELLHEDFLCIDDGAVSSESGAKIWERFTQIRAEAVGQTVGNEYDEGINFNPERSTVFHYNIWAHKLCPEHGTASGISRLESETQREFIVSLGGWRDNNVGYVRDQTGTFMHELGHNLGLKHGGHDDNNYKPNYFSVMNYHFQVQGLQPDQNNNREPIFDFSRYNFPALDENMLSEKEGLQSPDPARIQFTRYRCHGVDGPPTMLRPLGVNFDWNCNNSIEDEAISADINPLDSTSPLTHTDVLTVQNDWENLSFIFDTELTISPADELPFSIQEAVEQNTTGEITITVMPTGTTSINTVTGSCTRFYGSGLDQDKRFSDAQYCWSSNIDERLENVGCVSEFIIEGESYESAIPLTEEPPIEGNLIDTPIRHLIRVLAIFV